MPYLLETLKSIEVQTYENWNILAWDNGSTDETVELLHDWIPARLPGIIVTDEPMGLGSSLAKMVNQCNTQLCARIDADDINAPDRLKKQVEYLLGNPEIAVVGSWTNRIDAQGENYGRLHSPPTKHDEIVHHMLHGNPIAHPTVMFRREAIQRAGNYRYVGPVNVEDYDIWMRVAAARFRLANIDLPLLNYRVHAGGTTQISQRENTGEKALGQRFVVNSPTLFGFTEVVADQLWQRRMGCALGALRRAAFSLQNRGITTNSLYSKSFAQAAQHRVARRDIITRLWLMMR